ncbi:MAG: guanine deaminase [Granulosicoccus sp.]
MTHSDSTQTGNLAIRASFVHCLDNPASSNNAAIDDAAIEFLEDGILLIEDGHVKSLTPANKHSAPVTTNVIDYSGKLIVPGFIDTHVHYPQVDVMASYGSQLLDWLERYTFPAEMRFDNPAVAADTAAFFLDQLLANGTTTALVFGTVHAGSVSAFFEAAACRHLRMIAGKVLMDRNAPEELCDTPESGYRDSKQLIKTWHGRDRLGYAVTPRFAPTSSGDQLAMAGRLLDEHPDVHLHTHLAENTDECDWVASLFPDELDYLAVYERHGLVRKRSVFAHAIHLSSSAWSRLAQQQAAVAHCPMSNLFIGSGLFDLRAATSANVNVGLGTDIGGGDSFSMLRVINEAYKIQQLQKNPLAPQIALYLATLGGARALDLDNYIGNFLPGKEADFVILDDQATPLLTRRLQSTKNWQERLFAWMMLGDDRAIYDTFILGQSAKRKQLINE